MSSTGTGLSLLIIIIVSGLRLIFLRISSTVDFVSSSISFISFVLDSLTFIFTWIDRDIKKPLIKLLTIIICCWGSQARTKAVVSKTTGACTSRVQIPSPALFLPVNF